MTLLADPVFAAYALSSVLVVLTLYGLAFATLGTRVSAGVVVNHEDLGASKGPALADTEHARVQRVKRAHLNALENAVPFFVTAFLYAQTAPGLTFARSLFFTFVAVRALHAVFYLRAKQPFRSICFALGVLVNLVMIVQIVRAVWSYCA